jgi:hypothetical protein
MTRVEASQLVAILFGSFPSTHVERRHVDAYVSGIEDLEAQAAAGAVNRLRRTSKFLPSIAEIRAACADQQHGPKRTGVEAYTEVTSAIRWHGRDYGQGSPTFRDPLIARCLGVWGSWNDCCNAPPNDPAARARFIEMYDNLATRTREELSSGWPLLPPQAPRRAFWLAKAPVGASAPAGPVASLATVLAEPKPEKPMSPPTTELVPRRWTAEEIDAALSAGGTK